ncbi:hypothetical protein [Gramella sp. AN32]|uniref:Uncharacterized protein n=1 Tax=Christiangramia antarctica TaxID=2058158 RepID=A0ABW5XAF3_9FLAO|nr:hypothetical protein [Gramella sp. AN32]MCM4156499.1 hypothetical protein [Gramella sp. AN32]
MELAKIKILLDKYDAGETSLKEENILKTYFQEHEVSEDLKAYKLIFAFASQQQKERSETPLRLKNKRNSPINWSAIAAVLVITFGILYFFQTDYSLTSDDMGSASEEEITYQKTKEALDMVSSFMNEGAAELGYLQEFNNTKNRIIQID